MKLEYQIIKFKNNCFNTKNEFEHLLQSADCFDLNINEKEIIFENIKIKYFINQYYTLDNKENIFIISFDIEKEKNIEKFEKFDTKFLNIISSYNSEMNPMHINTLTDEISKYYGKLLYSSINEIEQKLRKIIYIFMEKNLGTSWINSIPKNDNSTEMKDDDFLSNTDFIFLINFLFKKYSKTTKEDIIKELESLSDVSIEKIKSIIKKHKEQSNYERYFNRELKEEEQIKVNLKKLYDIRNKVAHNKRIRKKEYDNANIIISKLQNIFDSCLTNMDKITVPDDEKESLENFGNNVINNIDIFNGINLINPLVDLTKEIKIPSLNQLQIDFPYNLNLGKFDNIVPNYMIDFSSNSLYNETDNIKSKENHDENNPK